MKNDNFIFILSSRSLKHLISVISRSHAKRDIMEIENYSAEHLFDEAERKEIAKLNKNFQKMNKVDESKEKYAELIKQKIALWQKND